MVPDHGRGCSGNAATPHLYCTMSLSGHGHGRTLPLSRVQAAAFLVDFCSGPLRGSPSRKRKLIFMGGGVLLSFFTGHHNRTPGDMVRLLQIRRIPSIPAAVVRNTCLCRACLFTKEAFDDCHLTIARPSAVFYEIVLICKTCRRSIMCTRYTQHAFDVGTIHNTTIIDK